MGKKPKKPAGTQCRCLECQYNGPARKTHTNTGIEYICPKCAGSDVDVYSEDYDDPEAS